MKQDDPSFRISDILSFRGFCHQCGVLGRIVSFPLCVQQFGFLHDCKQLSSELNSSMTVNRQHY